MCFETRQKEQTGREAALRQLETTETDIDFRVATTAKPIRGYLWGVVNEGNLLGTTALEQVEPVRVGERSPSRRVP